MKIKILILFFISVSTFASGQEVANIADPRLQIKLPDVKGDSISLVNQKGKVVLLDFWASWCGPCRLANRHLVKLYDKYQSKGLEIFSVSLDEEPASWKKAIARDKIKWLQVNDPRGSWNATTARDWNISVLPTTFLIDKKGNVVAIDLEGKQLEAKLASLLKE